MNAALWIVALPLVAGPVAYLAGRAGRTPDAPARRSLPRAVALIAILAAWVAFLVAAGAAAAGRPATALVGTITLRLDGLGLLQAAVALSLGALATLFSGPDLAGEANEEKYYAILLIMLGAVIGLGSASDLFNLWIWFETMAIASYVLVAFYRDRPGALEAGVKYLVQSALGSGLILIGIALVLAQTGTLDLDELGTRATTTPILAAAGGLFVIGFGVKAALVPLHTWLPDAHAEAPSAVSALLSGIVIEAGLLAMVRVLAALAAAPVSWGGLLLGAGAVNMLAGNLLALRQRYLKRLLAFSSVSQIGYIMLGLGIGVSTGSLAAAEGGVFHLVAHGALKGLAFLAAGALVYALHVPDAGGRPVSIDDLSGAARRYPLTAALLSAAVLGLAGLPPLAAFMSKWQISAAGVATGDPAIAILVVFAAANSVLSLAYYAPIVNAVYRQTPSSAVLAGRRIPVPLQVPLVLLAAAALAMGVWPAVIRPLVYPAAVTVLTAFRGIVP